jgi:hypothetical protein
VKFPEPGAEKVAKVGKPPPGAPFSPLSPFSTPGSEETDLLTLARRFLAGTVGGGRGTAVPESPPVMRAPAGRPPRLLRLVLHDHRCRCGQQFKCTAPSCAGKVVRCVVCKLDGGGRQ